jgi:hypothetical protein
MTTVNLTALAEARAKMDEADWTFRLDGYDVRNKFGEDVCSVERQRNMVGIVATHNVADVLIEVARTGREWMEARERLLAMPWGNEQSVQANLVNDALDRHREALAKVSL